MWPEAVQKLWESAKLTARPNVSDYNSIVIKWMVWCKGQFIACKSAFVETSHSDKRFHIIFNMNKLIFIAIFLKNVLVYV